MGRACSLSFLALAGVADRVARRRGEPRLGLPTAAAGVRRRVLALLMFAVGLNLSGLFEIGGAGVAGVGGRLAMQAGAAGSFFTGVLAVVVATPCTAPFMGDGHRLRPHPAAGVRARRDSRARARSGAAVPGARAGRRSSSVACRGPAPGWRR